MGIEHSAQTYRTAIIISFVYGLVLIAGHDHLGSVSRRRAGPTLTRQNYTEPSATMALGRRPDRRALKQRFLRQRDAPVRPDASMRWGSNTRTGSDALPKGSRSTFVHRTDYKSVRHSGRYPAPSQQLCHLRLVQSRLLRLLSTEPASAPRMVPCSCYLLGRLCRRLRRRQRFEQAPRVRFSCQPWSHLVNA